MCSWWFNVVKMLCCWSWGREGMGERWGLIRCSSGGGLNCGAPRESALATSWLPVNTGCSVSYNKLNKLVELSFLNEWVWRFFQIQNKYFLQGAWTNPRSSWNFGSDDFTLWQIKRLSVKLLTRSHELMLKASGTHWSDSGLLRKFELINSKDGVIRNSLVI